MQFTLHWPQWVFLILVFVLLLNAVLPPFDGFELLTKLLVWGGLAIVLWFGGFFSQACAQTVPNAAAPYRSELTRAAQTQWGLDAPVAALAAQVHQESGWQPAAVSRVGAQGMAQFMPSTATWWCKLNGLSAAACQPNNPTWALRALAGYDHWLYQRVSARDSCNRLAMALSAYNGGLGWVNRDKALAQTMSVDASTWFDQVERVNAGRSAANWRENRDYPRRILLKLTPAYSRAGWGAEVCV